jgi:small subunit ribosomal protein S27Ae
MAKEKGGNKKKSVKKSNFYGVSDNKIERKHKNCPKCGDGVFLAEHKNRVSCGRCGYTEFKK